MSRAQRLFGPAVGTRRSTFGLAFTGALLVALLATGVAQAVAVTIGYRDFAYDPGLASRATADSQQSKLWFANNTWYGGFYSSADNSFNIWRLNSGTHVWSDSHIKVDLRDRVHADYLFDSTNNVLYVASTKASCTTTTNGCNDAIYLYRFVFTPANGLASQYTLDAGFPKTIIGGTYSGTPPSAGGADTVTVALDNQRVYVAYTRMSASDSTDSATTSLAYSTDVGPKFGDVMSAPSIMNAGEAGQDNISALVTYGTDPAAPNVGLFYTDRHASSADVGFFQEHTNGDAGNVWQTAETASASSTNNQASVKGDTAGNVYVAYKTGAGVGTSAQISLLKRTPGAVWTARGVSDVDSTNVRPQLAIDPTFNGGAGAAFVIMNPTDDVDGNIYYKVAPLTGAGALSYTTTGRGTRLIDSATDNDIEDATTTKQVLTAASGLVVTATDKTSKFYMHNEFALSDTADSSGPVGTVVINGNPTPDSTKLTAVSVVLSATDTNAVVNMRYGLSPDGATCPTTGTPALLTTGTTAAYSTAAIPMTLATGDGVKAVCAQFQDFVGNWSAPVKDTITLDTAGPVGTVSINGGAATTSLGTVSVAVSATDPSTVTQVRLSNAAAVDGSGILTTGETRTYGTPQSWTLTPGDGVKTVYVQWKDGLGTWSAVSNDTITLDSVDTTYTAIAPTRMLDTRVNNPAGVTILKHGIPQSFQITGRTVGSVTIPANAVAITGNLTVVGSTASGFVSLGPDVPAIPTSSTINFPLGDTRANGVFVPLDGTGKLEATYRANGSSPGTKKTHLVLDVTGYFVNGAAGNEYFPVTPARYLDTRVHNPANAHILHNGVPYAFQVGGRTVGGTTIPADAVAITGNLTVTGQTKKGYLSLTPDSQPVPATSTLNFPAGDNRANNVTVKLGAGGNLYVVYRGTGVAHAILDVTGYFRDDAAGLAYVPVTPTRTVDTRLDQGILNPLQASAPKSWTIRGFAGVENDAMAFTGNLTVTGQTRKGFISVTPTPNSSPTTSTINFPVGETRANGIAAPINNADGKSSVVYKPKPNSGKVEFIVDITGYFH
jgi:hypothetical protein